MFVQNVVTDNTRAEKSEQQQHYLLSCLIYRTQDLHRLPVRSAVILSFIKLQVTNLVMLWISLQTR
jgi:hypothetical protein